MHALMRAILDWVLHMKTVDMAYDLPASIAANHAGWPAPCALLQLTCGNG